MFGAAIADICLLVVQIVATISGHNRMNSSENYGPNLPLPLVVQVWGRNLWASGNW